MDSTTGGRPGAVQGGAAKGRVIQLLQREYLFQGLNIAQLAQVANYFEQKTYEHNEEIFGQGQEADAFYIVLSGSVRVTREGRDGKPKLLNILGPGDFFGEESLLFHRPRSATVASVERTTVLRLEQQAFQTVLQLFPQIRNNLSATAESRRLARRVHFDWLGEDEVIYLLARKHEFFLFVGLFIPVTLALASIPTLSFGLMEQANHFVFTAATAASGAMFVLGVVWGIWNYIDWGNDYYLVTSQRVIWLEKIVGLYDSRREAPLDSILAVNVTSSQLGRILHYGNVNVRTYTGGILMVNMKHPDQFGQFVEGYKRRVIAISKEQEAQAMEHSLDHALRKSLDVVEHDESTPLPPAPGGPPEGAVMAPAAPSMAGGPAPLPAALPLKPPQKKKPSGFRQALDTFLKVRYEENGIITYRKHWFILVQRAWKPLLGLALIAGGLGTLAWLEYANGTPAPWLLACSSTGLVGLGLLMWLVYDYWDWNNDIYRLTKEQLLDIERRPLGQENKKSANLDAILSIEHTRANLIGIILNFGDVIINVGTTEFTFDGVYNPDQVHSDIADYREALLRRKRLAEAERERERMVTWLVTFYNEAEKIEAEREKNNPDGSKE